MTLRRKLALSVVLTAIPLAVGLLWLRGESQRQSIEREISEFVEGTMQSGGRFVCEAFPSTFGGGGPLMGPRGSEALPFPMPEGMNFPKPPAPVPGRLAAMWAYDSSFQSANARAPTVSMELREALESGADRASTYFDWDGVTAMRLLVRMPWTEGPCAVMLVERQVEERLAEGGIVFWGLAVLCACVLGGVLLTAGAMVRRIRGLGASVRRAAATGYETSIDEGGGDEIAVLARDFNEAGALVRRHVQTVEERRQTLRDFVANTTHDVMIPLTVLQGHLAGIRERHEASLPLDDDAIRDSLREAHYLGSLMHNLGAAAKLDTGAAEAAMGAVDLSSLVDRVVKRHRPVADVGGVELDYAVPEQAVEARGDVTLIEQAVNNLVHNAVRYGNRGGHVSVLLALGDGRFKLTVWDDGPGVTEEQLGRLAEPGFRATEARTRDPGGAGLGLAIVRDVADRHDFELELRRLDEGGLEVSLAGPAS